MRFGISRASSILAKLILTFLPSLWGLTITVITPFKLINHTCKNRKRRYAGRKPPLSATPTTCWLQSNYKPGTRRLFRLTNATRRKPKTVSHRRIPVFWLTFRIARMCEITNDFITFFFLCQESVLCFFYFLQKINILTIC